MKEQLTTLAVGALAALAALIPVAAGLVKAWLEARTEAVRQAALGAASQVEQLSANVPMTGAEKKQAAVNLAMQRLPEKLRSEAKVDDHVEQVVPEVRARSRSTRPPADGVGPVPGDDDADTVDTIRDRPRRPR